MARPGGRFRRYLLQNFRSRQGILSTHRARGQAWCLRLDVRYSSGASTGNRRSSRSITAAVRMGRDGYSFRATPFCSNLKVVLTKEAPCPV